MSGFYDEIVAAINKPAGKQDLAKIFLNGTKEYQRYVVGRNELSESLTNLVEIDGVIDDFHISESNWNNIPIISSKDLPDNSIVVNCSTSISPISVNRMLKELRIENVLNANEVIYADKEGSIKTPWFVQQMREDYKLNSKEWNKIYNILYDQESKKTFLDIMRYRLTGDTSYMESYSVRLLDQYLEDFMQYKHEIFADIGGFDGDTTNEFCTRYPNYKKVLFFEPSEKNMLAAKNRLKNFHDIQYFSVGLSDKEETLFFNSNNGSASSINNSGETKINVSSLDKISKEPVSVIKMDIEGWELKALTGSCNQIRINKPKLAIAVYHNSNDFWIIPNYILSLYSGYKIYIRHYTEGWSETVMYFVPE